MVVVTRADLTLEILTRKGLCRWCGKPVPVGNRFYCSSACCNKTYDKYLWAYVRRAVLKRDSYKCVTCEKSLAEPSPYNKTSMMVTEKFEIHHIITFLQLMRDVGTGFRGNHNDYKIALLNAYVNKKNLITLCLKCHGKEYHPRFVEKKDHLEDRVCSIKHDWSDTLQDKISVEGFGFFWTSTAPQMNLFDYF